MESFSSEEKLLGGDVDHDTLRCQRIARSRRWRCRQEIASRTFGTRSGDFAGPPGPRGVLRGTYCTKSDKGNSAPALIFCFDIIDKRNCPIREEYRWTHACERKRIFGINANLKHRNWENGWVFLHSWEEQWIGSLLEASPCTLLNFLPGLLFWRPPTFCHKRVNVWLIFGSTITVKWVNIPALLTSVKPFPEFIQCCASFE